MSHESSVRFAGIRRRFGLEFDLYGTGETWRRPTHEACRDPAAVGGSRTTDEWRVDRAMDLRRSSRRRWWRDGVAAQPPAPPGSPSTEVVCNRRGRLHRMFHHTAHALENDVLGHPDAFIEPPLGYYINRQFAVQVAEGGYASVHAL